MANLIEGAEAMHREARRRRVAPGFLERLDVARGVAILDRSIAAPYYLTDLGVRRFSDPSLFYRAHMELGAWTIRIVPEDTRDLLLSAPLSDLAWQLDALILLTGDYDTGTAVVTARAHEIVASDDARLRIYAGVLLAAAGDVGCRPMLREVARLPVGGSTAFMALHRLAAAEIKRFGDPRAAIEALADAEASLVDLGPSDRAALLSVAANLRALALLKLGDPRAAESELDRARDLVSLTNLVQVHAAEASRYLAQEHINVAQMQIGSRPAKAVESLQESVQFCRAHARDYVSEALAALAVGCFHASEFQRAVEAAQEAVDLLAFEAAPSRLRATREVAIGSFARLGRMDEARMVLAELRNDPLGFLAADRLEGKDVDA